MTRKENLRSEKQVLEQNVNIVVSILDEFTIYKYNVNTKFWNDVYN